MRVVTLALCMFMKAKHLPCISALPAFLRGVGGRSMSAVRANSTASGTKVSDVAVAVALPLPDAVAAFASQWRAAAHRVEHSP